MTRKGKLTPLDAEPNPDGNVRLVDDWRVGKRGLVQVCEVIPSTGALDLGIDSTDRFMPHFASCPHAERFRRAS